MGHQPIPNYHHIMYQVIRFTYGYIINQSPTIILCIRLLGYQVHLWVHGLSTNTRLSYHVLGYQVHLWVPKSSTNTQLSYYVLGYQVHPWVHGSSTNTHLSYQLNPSNYVLGYQVIMFTYTKKYFGHQPTSEIEAPLNPISHFVQVTTILDYYIIRLLGRPVHKKR